MATKMAESFVMAEIETKLIQLTKQHQAKRMSLWDSNRKDVDRLIEQANRFYPTIKFTAEISENEIHFLDTVVFSGERFTKEVISRDREFVIPSSLMSRIADN